MSFSIIMPTEYNRLPLLLKTLEKYNSFGFNCNVEFLIITRSIPEYTMIPFVLPENSIVPFLRIIEYDWPGEPFNPSMALNIGVRNAQYNNIIITCPEVKPITNVLKQLQELPEGNYVCQVFDQNQNNEITTSLVNTNYRSQTPMMYFLACFKKEDLYKINGWDEEFMGGYAYEDNDFGQRFVRAGLKFEVLDDVQAEHQWHPRLSLGTNAAVRNAMLLEMNNNKKVIIPKKGLVKYE